MHRARFGFPRQAQRFPARCPKNAKGHATPLSLPDRLLGAVFGFLRGGVLLLVVATVVALTPASQSQGWRASRGVQWLNVALASLKPLLHFLPDSAARLSRR